MRSQSTILPVFVILCALSPLAAAPPPAAPAGRRAGVDFTREVRSILSDKCFRCHGPDAAERKAKLRLDVAGGILARTRSGEAIVAPGKPDESVLVQRILSSDPDEVMPPAASGKTLSDAEKALLQRWIAEGAQIEEHWAFVPPRRPALPPLIAEDAAPADAGASRAGDWPRQAIDRFVAARRRSHGLEPAAMADRATLCRRLSLELTGLPPDPGLTEEHVADTSPDAHERLVDRLLASPHHGERLAVEWLDAARFADTNGYHIDNGRDMTRWREWVIEAFNTNKPFDRFTIEQLAGDLLPGAGVEQRIASGFHRNHMINFEGGAIPEEYHNAYIVDRVNTTGMVWLGLTVNCAQCHDHKYDPITQREYYELYSFFHNVPEKGLDGFTGNSTPMLRLPTEEQTRELDRLGAAIAAAEARLAGPDTELDVAQSEWEGRIRKEIDVPWVVLAPEELRSAGGAELRALDDGSVLASGVNPVRDSYTIAARCALEEVSALRLEALPDDSLPARGPGRNQNGNAVLTHVSIAARPAAGGGEPAPPATIKAATANHSQQGHGVERAIDGKSETGWALLPETGKASSAIFELAEPLRGAGGVELSVTLEFQSRFTHHQLGRFRLLATSSRTPHADTTLPARVREALAAAAPSDADRTELRSYFRRSVSERGKEMVEDVARLRKERDELEKQVPSAMVMEEMAEKRQTFVLVRGQYDKPGAKVEAAVPAFLPPLPADAPRNRLGLARWLVDPTHPLTSRVQVNRHWQMVFGTGLVKTSEDFGSQGEQPSHPDLLDWLAVEFVDRGWDTRDLLRTLVTSSTYRQSSAVSAAALAQDPENRLLARGPRARLHAEFIRDQALAASGLLDLRIGGASVFPYQPPGLWEELAYRDDGRNWTAQTYTPSSGRDLYRRTMYTFWKRTSPPPTLATFDAPDRETCTVRRARTNTPLQALILLNDPTYVEASRELAARVMREAGSARERIERAFRLVVSRAPRSDEAAVLGSLLDEELAAFRADPQAAAALLGVGESSAGDRLEPAELAAWTMIASTVLNLDEAVTKN